MLRLVQDDGGEVAPEIRVLEVALQERVRRDNDVRPVDLREGARAVRSRDDEHLLPRRELLRLGLPVADERRGADDEGGERRSGRRAGQAEPGEGLEGLAEAHLVREESAERGVLQKAHPVDALLLVGTEDRLEPAERDGLELRVRIARLHLGVLPPFLGVDVVEVEDVAQRFERAADVRRVDGLHAEPARRRAVLGRRAVLEDVVHRLDRLVVQQDHGAVLQDVTVAAVQRGLDLDGRDVRSHRVEGVLDVEGAVGSVLHLHGRDDGRHLVRQVGQLRREVDPPAAPPEVGESRAEEVQHLLRIGDVELEVALAVALLEAPGRLEQLQRLALGVHRPRAPDERIVRIGKADERLGLQRAGGEVDVVVPGVHGD